MTNHTTSSHRQHLKQQSASRMLYTRLQTLKAVNDIRSGEGVIRRSPKITPRSLKSDEGKLRGTESARYRPDIHDCIQSLAACVQHLRQTYRSGLLRIARFPQARYNKTCMHFPDTCPQTLGAVRDIRSGEGVIRRSPKITPRSRRRRGEAEGDGVCPIPL